MPHCDAVHGPSPERGRGVGVKGRVWYALLGTLWPPFISLATDTEDCTYSNAIQ